MIQSSTNDALRQQIIDLTRQHKLTSLEISCHLAERPDVTQTQQEITRLLDELASRGEFQVINATQEPLYRPTALSPAERRAWDLVDRSESARWIEENTTLDGFYRNRIYYLNVTKSLKTSGHNSYNHVLDPGGGPCEILLDGKKYVHFASNDYVGLANHPEVLEAARQTLATHGLGSGGSRISSGTTSPHHELERTIARFKGAEAAIVFGAGYMMNLAMASMADESCVIFSDELNHASIIDGIRLSRVQHVRFAHNDMADLEEKLSQASPSTRKFIIVEGVYSMDGDIVKLDQLVEVARRHDARIGLDEAHSSGALGAHGRGVVEHFGLEPGVIEFKAGTLGKSFAASGGFITGKQLVIDMLKYTTRSFVFSTSLPAVVMAGAQKAIEVLERHPELAQRVQANARYLRTHLKEMGFDTGLSETQIIPIILGDNDKVGRFYQALLEAGIFMNYAIHPIVPLKQARLRLSVSAAHTQQQMDYLLEILRERGRAFGVI
jgi:glycine C-acetyltransferase